MSPTGWVKAATPGTECWNMRLSRTICLVVMSILTGLVPTLSVPAASAATIASACPSVAPAPPHTTIPSRHLLGPQPVGPLAVTGTSIVMSSPGAGLLSYISPDDTRRDVHVDNAALGRLALAADSAGNTYHIRYPYNLMKYDAQGVLLWDRQLDPPLNSVFIIGAGTNARVGAVYRDSGNAALFTLNGVPAGTMAIQGRTFTSTTDSGVLGIDGRYARIFSNGGDKSWEVGDTHQDNDPSPAAAPLHFYQLGGAAQLPDGHVVATDTQRGLMVFSSTGLLEGSLPATEIDPLGLTQSSAVVVRGDKLVIETGLRFSSQQYLTEISIADVLARTGHGESQDGPARLQQRLGLGAGLLTPVVDSYFPVGTPVSVRAYFDPWWHRVASGLAICWTIQDQDEVRGETFHWGGTLPLPNVSFGGSGTALDLPADLPPGAYELDARLLDGGKAISSTTLLITVGAAGQRLDIAGLPAGADFGGPGPVRSVVLADELGTKTTRAGVNWGSLLRNGADAPLYLADEQARLGAASAEAQKRGVTLEVQIGQGGAAEKGLVSSGAWERRVSELVAGLKNSVHIWEAWNEPNLTYGPAPSYVHDILAPFYRAVKTSDPTATVVGGSTAGIDLGYWDQLSRAGGFSSMDVAGVHPYTGHNRSWEEDNFPRYLRILKDFLTHNAHGMPLWNTEQSFWSNGPANLFGQADSTSREVLWSKAIGIDKWAYFISEGAWGDNGVTYSAIEVSSFVKPAALALMTAYSQLDGRPYLGEVNLGAPSTYGMRFGPKVGDANSGELLAVWTDGLRLPAVLASATDGLAVTQTSDLGASSTSVLHGGTALTLDNAPVFLTVNGPGRLSVQATESFGTNLAASIAGATATASSDRPGNEVAKAIDGESGTNGGGGLQGAAAWASAPGDGTKTLDVHLASAQVLDRVLVSTHSNFSVVTGLRDYDVELRAGPDEPWVTVRQVRGQFQHRSELINFTAQKVSDIRVHVLEVNYSGYLPGGVRPSWWPMDAAAQALATAEWYGPAVVSELYAYAPGSLVVADAVAPSPATPLPSPQPAASADPSAATSPPVGAMGNPTPASPTDPITIMVPDPPVSQGGPIPTNVPTTSGSATGLPPGATSSPSVGMNATDYRAVDAAAARDASAAARSQQYLARAQAAAAAARRTAVKLHADASKARASASTAASASRARTSRRVHLARVRATRAKAAAATQAERRAQAAQILGTRLARVAWSAQADYNALATIAAASRRAAIQARLVT